MTLWNVFFQQKGTLNGQLLIITMPSKPGAHCASHMLDSVKLSCPLVFDSCNLSDTLVRQNPFPQTLSQVIISN